MVTNEPMAHAHSSQGRSHTSCQNAYHLLQRSCRLGSVLHVHSCTKASSMLPQESPAGASSEPGCAESLRTAARPSRQGEQNLLCRLAQLRRHAPASVVPLVPRPIGPTESGEELRTTVAAAGLTVRSRAAGTAYTGLRPPSRSQFRHLLRWSLDSDWWC